VAEGRLSIIQPAGAPPGVPWVICSMRPASVPRTPVFASTMLFQSTGAPDAGVVRPATSVALTAWIRPISAE